MKITEKQLMRLFVARNSISMHDGGALGVSIEERIDLVNDILNQQSDEIVDVGNNIEPYAEGYNVVLDMENRKS